MRWLPLAAMLLATGAGAAPESSLRPVPRAEPPRIEMDDSLRPALRPSGIRQQAKATQRARRRGSVCGDPALQGKPVGRVPGKLPGCGLSDAVRVTSVAGIGLSQPAVMDCTTAKALKRWVERSAKPALRKKGGLTRLRVAAHYACRTRNNRPGAKISEHGRGRAIDISGFQLDNGQMVSVLDGWNSRKYRKALRAMHRGACGPFGTVLGPDADRFHRDHFHFDTARYRSGSYCR